MRRLINYLLLSLVVILIQVLILNNVNIAGFGVPFLYVWLIFRLPNSLRRWFVISMGFLIGFIIDMFSNTPGMHSFACVTLAYLKEPIMALYVPKEDMKTGIISIKLFGAIIYVKFLITALLFYCSAIYLLESFSLFNLINVLMKISSSFITTFILIFALESIKSSNK